MAKPAWLPLHTIFLGIYPVVALMAANIQESPLEDGWRALWSAPLAALIILGLAGLLTRDWRRAALAASILLASFFSYGHAYTGLKLSGEIGAWVARHRFLIPIWLSFTALAIWWAVKRVEDLDKPTAALNFAVLFLMVVPAFQIVTFILRNQYEPQGPSEVTLNTDPQKLAIAAPDIYYIVTDAYARDDVMQEFYNFDNSQFLGQLERLGFYVARCSLSNYPKTRLSLSSSLNMDYLENLGITANDQADEFWRRIRNSVVRKTLAAQGYKIVSLETGFYWTEWQDADLYLSHRNAGFQLNAFETLLLQTTLLRAPIDLFSGKDEQATSTIEGSKLEEHYEITRFALDALNDLAYVEGPKFVFAHLLIPHEPYVFDAEGYFTTEPRSLAESYGAQITYLNKRLIESLTSIITESARPVVIILQGDHGGPGTQFIMQDRMKILNAYYLPDGKDQLYPSITPVNSFRIVFDAYFDTEYGLLDDRSLFSTPNDLFDVTLVSDDNPACMAP